MCASPLPSVPLFILITQTNLGEIEKTERGAQEKNGHLLKCDSSQKAFNFRQELCFSNVCVSHWKYHLTTRVVDSKKARGNKERESWKRNIGKSVKRELVGEFDSIKE